MLSDVRPSAVEVVAPLRALYWEKMHCQSVHHSLARRWFNGAFVVLAEGRVAGNPVLVPP